MCSNSMNIYFFFIIISIMFTDFKIKLHVTRFDKYFKFTPHTLISNLYLYTPVYSKQAMIW